MNRVEIDKEKLFNSLTNDNIVGQGSNGIISEYDENTLIKVYYKKLLETYETKNINILDKEVNRKIQVSQIMSSINKSQQEIEALEEQKLEVLEKLGLLNGVVFYKGMKVGVLLQNYKDYKKLTLVFEQLSKEDQMTILNKIKTQILELISNKVYPLDVKEDNILVNPNTLDVALIDLDDNCTRYEEQEYIIKKNLGLEDVCEEKYNKMVKRLSER